MRAYNYSKNSNIRQLSVRRSNFMREFTLLSGRFDNSRRVSNYIGQIDTSGSYLIYFRFNGGSWTDTGSFNTKRPEYKIGSQAEGIDIDIIPRDGGVEFITTYRIGEVSEIREGRLVINRRDEAVYFAEIKVEIKIVSFDLW